MTSTSVTSYVNSRDTMQQNVVDSQARVYAWVATTTLTEIQLELEDLNEMYRNSKKLRDNVSDKVSTAEYAADHKKEFDTLLNSLRNLRIRVIELINTRQAASAAARAPPTAAGQQAQAAGAQSSAFKLERIKLPQFSGKFNEWQSFHDLFVSSVHPDNTKSGAEKMLHLKSCLVGDAAAIVSSFQPTDAGYNDAWDLVVKRYSNKREIIFAHIRKFDEIKALNQESPSGLRGVSDSVSECVRSLKTLNVPVEHWDLMMIYFALKKLDTETKKEWLLLQKADLPKLQEFIEFLESRARALCDSTLSAPKNKQYQEKKSSAHSAAVGAPHSIVCPSCAGNHYLYRCKTFQNLSVNQRYDFVDKKKLCYNCLNKGHSVLKCNLSFVCRSCGKRHHTMLHRDNKPPSKQDSSGAPNAQLPPPPPAPSQNQNSDSSTSVGTSHGTTKSSSVVLLGTFNADVRDAFGRKTSCRVFLDPGSESHFISEQCVDRLGLKREKTCVKINGIGDSASGTATGIVNLRLYSKVRDYELDIRALVYKKITGLIPKAERVSTFDYLEHLELGDPYFYLPGPTDVLLGAKAAGIIMLPGIMHGEPGSPVAQNSQFGWILSGSVKSVVSVNTVTSSHAMCSISDPCLESTLTKFWELEDGEIAPPAPLSEEDALCEAHFLATYKRDNEGRYMVELPFKPNAPSLGSSRQAALKRFLNMERRLKDKPIIKNDYIQCMRDAMASNWMELVPEEQIQTSDNSDAVAKTEEHIDPASTSEVDMEPASANSAKEVDKDPASAHGAVEELNQASAYGAINQAGAYGVINPAGAGGAIGVGINQGSAEGAIEVTAVSSYYMPHREVIKESSSTTKVRIVFDASAKTSSGVSLNDVLMTGPTLQANLVQLLIRFRSHLFAMSADIVKFYPQFLVNPKLRDFHRLLWRETPDLPIQIYRMNRITFGVTSAPFLAMRSLHQLAEDEGADNQLIKSIIKEDFLVDNLLTGANSIEGALSIQSEVLRILGEGQLELRKWSSNCKEILDSVPEAHRDHEFPLKISENESVKTIGILWYPGTDTFGISIVVPDESLPPTKRNVLSAIARIFDPLGWLSPVTVRPKMLMQELWEARLGWDEILPGKLQEKWYKYVEDLEVLQNFSVDRCIARPPLLAPPYSTTEHSHFELHGFSDASQHAYSACIYTRTVNVDGNSLVNLVIAKTKVAPIKYVSITRLELCGGVLLAKLMRTVKESCNMEFHVVRCWTDSTTVLDWLESDKKLPVFVANRARKISNIYPSSFWFHIKGSENPADCASRGISSAALLNHQLRYHGPPWLSTESFPYNTLEDAPTGAGDNSTTFVAEENSNRLSSIVNNISSFTRMKRVMALVLRFISNIIAATKPLARPSEIRKIGHFTLKELNQALTHIIRVVQAESLEEELSSCRRDKTIKSSIKFLSPFIDSNGILRVGGRLQHSTLSTNQKHPILLPKNHNFTEVIVRYFHLAHPHAPPALLLALLREQFWIIRGPDAARNCVRKCIICHRQNHSTAKQIMGQLPAPRVNASRAFCQTGLDFAGPFYLCLRPGRNPKIIKSYVCLFVCMSTRAVHLELVGDLSTPAFIAALNRFFSRRGLSSDIYCDGGKNFVGAANEIKEFDKFISSEAQVSATSEFLVEKGVTFHFNPPLSPHHGGLWEAGVKSMKHHLKRVIEDRKLSIEEFTTLLCQIEAVLNSRLLTPLTSDPNDMSVLTPGHFLIGANLSSLPDHDLTHLNTNRLSRWQLVQQMFQHFWKRWSAEYLKGLQSRPKWYAPQPNLEVGVLVLIIDDDLTWGPLRWKLGRIIKTYPGADNQVRVCDVKTSSGSILKRPVVKLSPLPIY